MVCEVNDNLVRVLENKPNAATSHFLTFASKTLTVWSYQGCSAMVTVLSAVQLYDKLGALWLFQCVHIAIGATMAARRALTKSQLS
jgi:hypothetical protein